MNIVGPDHELVGWDVRDNRVVDYRCCCGAVVQSADEMRDHCQSLNSAAVTSSATTSLPS
jgi:hypothetical protein